MQPFPRHDRFFSSLKKVEERLASEDRTKPAPTIDPIQSLSSSDDLSSPLYLGLPQPAGPGPALIPDSSGPPPQEFLSSSPQAPAPDPAERQPSAEHEDEDSEADDIERLINLLGLSEHEDGVDVGWGCGSCHCSGGGFYSKVAGVKGPRCEEEARRLEGWIEYYTAERKEPARLAHLLLAKAACLSGGDDDDGCEGTIEFPSTIEEFLERDPPRLS